MKNAFVWFVVVWFCFSFCFLSAQRNNSGYWQQHVDYNINVDVDINNYKYTGKQKVIYTNNSPDTLKSVYFHLYFNAFKPDSEMDVRSRKISDPDPRVLDKISKLSLNDQGNLSVDELKLNGNVLNGEVAGTILEVDLNDPILPGKKGVFELTFQGKIPLIVRRAGKMSAEGVALSMAQWYPKIAEYDYEGWHADPYIGREFYGVWGDFDVTIKIDKNFIVAGTGYLKKKEKAGSGSNKLSWNFIAPKVHDFTWAADPDFVKDSIQAEKDIILNFYYKKTLNKKYLKNWKKLQPVTRELMRFFNKKIGLYPYNQYSVIQGGDGGMEYGMCTLITGERDFSSLVGVTAHELAHSWFHFVLATNESQHEWMDEGFTEYFGTEAESNIVGLDKNLYKKNAFDRYKSLVKSGLEQPQTTHADRYEYNTVYSVSAYIKGFIFLAQLKYLIGEKAFESSIKKYFNDWSFKHPTPNDFIRCAEKISGAELSWYLNDWTRTTNTIDYGIKNFYKEGTNNLIEIERIGLMPMPIEVLISYEDKSTDLIYVPLQMMRKTRPLKSKTILLKDWPWAQSSYVIEINTNKKIKSIQIDPSESIADINIDNNLLLTTENEKAKGQ